MAWKVELTKTAARNVASLGQDQAKRILRFLHDRLATRDNPRELGAALHGPWAGYWKYRVGDYRLIASIEDDLVRILVVRIGHRSDVY
jgi:mRNA interferase RelE/StbE